MIKTFFQESLRAIFLKKNKYKTQVFLKNRIKINIYSIVFHYHLILAFKRNRFS